jgi:hypothetical protein
MEMEDGLGVGFFSLKALIVNGREGRGLYFFTFLFSFL